jgi:indolepyruvate ferredoxin oxidoreductase, beta subunit
MAQPITVLIAALGGEGGGVLAEWLVSVATQAGYPVQSTSIPGVAQRTGATTYYVEIYPEPVAMLGGRRPVLSLLPVPGAIDLVVASELLEAVRTIQSGMVSADRTLLITSVSRTLTTTEKMPLGDGRFDSAALLDVARTSSRELRAFDLEAIARDAGTVVSAVMYGAIAASGVLPFAREAFESVIRESDRGVDASLAGFAGAWEAMQAAAPRPRQGQDGPAMPRATPALPDRLRETFPPAAQEIISIGYARLVEYQDRDYAELYGQRLGLILATERARDPEASHGFALTRETARFLALWMAFDDIVRVAQLKCRASRFARVRREVAAGGGDIVRIVDYFKPGLPEFSSLLPAALARRLAAWDRRRRARGKAPLAFALALRTDSVWGFAALRTVAGLRPLRRRGARFAQEQALIGRWLQAIETAARDDWRCGYEVALCGRLIKGYGATNERGKENLIWIIDRLAAGGPFATAEQRGQAIREAREAALADEAGAALDQVLQRHGAGARPVKAQPIVWAKRTQAGRDEVTTRQSERA